VFACACGRIGFAPLPTQDGGDGSGVSGEIAPANACGTNVVLSDTFSAPVTGTEWTVNQTADATVAQGSGLLTIAFAASVQNNVLAGYKLAATTNFANACVTVELSSIPSTTTSAVVIFSIGSATQNVRLMEVVGELQSLCESGGNLINHLDGRPYDVNAHRFLRLRNAGATGWYWEASPDNITFTILAASACTSVATTNILNLLAGADSGTSSAGECVYDAVTIAN
jgi:hypothetical protein